MHNVGSSWQFLHVKKGNLFRLLLYSTPRRTVPAHQPCHTLHVALTPSCLSHHPLSVGGKCGPPSLVNKSLWPYTLTQSQGSPRSLCFTPITDDPIPSFCFFPYNAQTCTWNATALLSGNVTYLITCLLMSLCVLYSTKLWVLKQQGMCNLRSFMRLQVISAKKRLFIFKANGGS